MTPNENQPTPPAYALPGLKVLLMGDAGTGKTHSLRTLVDSGLEVFALFTEPGMDVVADIPSSKLHWNYVSPSTVSWGALRDSAHKINTMAFKTLAELPHVNRGEHAEFLQVLKVLDDFIDQRTGISHGSTQAFGPDKVLWLDSWSGLSVMAMNLIAGSKPVKHVGDYGVAMDNLENVAEKLTNDLKCHVVVVGHMGRERDEMTGGTSMMLETLGSKLAPKLPKLFTDVINARRNEKTFSWSTITPNTILKARNLPWAENQPPSFAPLIENWRKREKLARGETA